MIVELEALSIYTPELLYCNVNIIDLIPYYDYVAWFLLVRARIIHWVYYLHSHFFKYLIEEKDRMC